MEIYSCYQVRIHLQLATQKPSQPKMYNFFKDKLQLHRRCSVKKVFFNILQNYQEKTCAGVSLILETFLKSDSSTVVFL